MLTQVFGRARLRLGALLILFQGGDVKITLKKRQQEGEKGGGEVVEE